MARPRPPLRWQRARAFECAACLKSAGPLVSIRLPGTCSVGAVGALARSRPRPRALSPPEASAPDTAAAAAAAVAAAATAAAAAAATPPARRLHPRCSVLRARASPARGKLTPRPSSRARRSYARAASNLSTYLESPAPAPGRETGDEARKARTGRGERAGDGCRAMAKRDRPKGGSEIRERAGGARAPRARRARARNPRTCRASGASPRC